MRGWIFGLIVLVAAGCGSTRVVTVFRPAAPLAAPDPSGYPVECQPGARPVCWQLGVRVRQPERADQVACAGYGRGIDGQAWRWTVIGDAAAGTQNDPMALTWVCGPLGTFLSGG